MMRLVSYNILCGGDARYGGSARLGDILDLLRDLQPDIVALQEANGFHDDKVRSRFTDALDLPHWAMAEGALYEDGDRYHTAVLSRYDLHDAAAFSGGSLQSAALSVMADTPIGPLQICSIHLHAYSEDERLKEVAHILSDLGGHPDRVMLGDFNSLARTDSARYAAVSENREFDVRFDVIDRIAASHIDIFCKSGEMPPATYPTGLEADHPFVTPRRIDHAFATPGVAGRVTSAAVIDSPLARRASDHFPLLVTVE